MRFTFVSLALLALAHSLAPGVHGAPAVDSDRVNSLAVRQDLASIAGVLSSLVNTIGALLGSAPLSPADVTKIVEQALQGATGLLPRALPSSSGAASPLSSPSSTMTFSTTTTTRAGLATGTASNVPSVSLSTPHAPSATLSRVRRQLTTPLPVSIPSVSIPFVPPTPTTPGAQSSHSSMQSVSASVASSRPATSMSTSSNPTPSASRV